MDVEDEVLSRARDGDRDALHQLLATYRPRIYRFCRARLADHEAAEDVTQEVCVALVKALPNHRYAEHTLSSFIFGIATNKIAMMHRSNYRRREDVMESLPDGVDSSPGPEQLALEADATLLVRKLMTFLPEQVQRLLSLRIAAGLSAEETAEVLGMTPGAVRVAQHRALQQLRAIAQPRVDA